MKSYKSYSIRFRIGYDGGIADELEKMEQEEAEREEGGMKVMTIGVEEGGGDLMIEEGTPKVGGAGKKYLE
jgi:hypothetical protein